MLSFFGVDAIVDHSPNGYGLIDVEVFTVDGTWTKPAGTTTIEVLCIAGGGGGGGTNNPTTSSRTNYAAGGGGGAASYLFKGDSISDSYTVTVGGGGTGGSTTPLDGDDGEDSSLGSICVAKGGSGGLKNTQDGGNVTAGAGGLASGGTGTLKLNGHQARDGRREIAGNTALYYVHGAGGPAAIGGGSRPTFNTTGSGGGQGVLGLGRGGHGGYSSTGQGSRSGSSGVVGIVIVKSYGTPG